MRIPVRRSSTPTVRHESVDNRTLSRDTSNVNNLYFPPFFQSFFWHGTAKSNTICCRVSRNLGDRRFWLDFTHFTHFCASGVVETYEICSRATARVSVLLHHVSLYFFRYQRWILSLRFSPRTALPSLRSRSLSFLIRHVIYCAAWVKLVSD